jgi:hypothetical protein
MAMRTSIMAMMTMTVMVTRAMMVVLNNLNREGGAAAAAAEVDTIVQISGRCSCEWSNQHSEVCCPNRKKT